MPPTDPVEPLLAAYLGRRGAPDAPTPESLCRDAPDLLPELRRRIAEAESAREAETPADAPTRLSDRRDLPGTKGDPEFPARLGEYAVRGVLGRGGMGAVLLADDTKLGRRVAVKVMLPRLAADPAARDRFLREARAAAAVHHDHVVPIFHVGEQDDVPFLVMPLLEGESLGARLKRHSPLPPDEVARIGREAALGLEAAHAKGLVHRDVKPANLWLEAPNERVKVLDFGLARAANSDGAITHTGNVLGTPAYMAPEQADGKHVDARADLFSLGATLYEAATGEAPFRRPTLTAVLRAVADHHPPPAHELNPAVPRGLSALVMRLLAKNPADRPTSARAVADELAPPVAATPGSVATIIATPAAPRRSRSVALWVGAALVPLIGFGVWLATRERSEQPAPVNPTANAIPAPPAPPAPVAVEPLRGSVDLLVYRTRPGGSDVVVRLNHELAMPLRSGDEFRIVAEVTRPAYLYLFWIDENGAGAPVYPWKLNEWGTRPATEAPVTKLNLSAPNGKAFEITGDARGMETIVMLARSTRLAATDAEVEGWFKNLKPLPFRGERDRVWFENFDVLEGDGERSLKYGGDVSEVVGPRGLQLALKQKVGSVELSRAISFARVGNSK